MEQSKTNELTPKQQAFVREYLLDLNATQAATRAGYSPDTARQIGSENLSKPDIQEAIGIAMTERAKRTQITSDYVLQKIRETVERCSQAEMVKGQFGLPVMIPVGEGEVAAAYRFDSNGVLKGCELLGKHLKLFTEKHEHSGPDGKAIPISQLTDEELEAQIATMLAKSAKEPQ